MDWRGCGKCWKHDEISKTIPIPEESMAEDDLSEIKWHSIMKKSHGPHGAVINIYLLFLLSRDVALNFEPLTK